VRRIWALSGGFAQDAGAEPAPRRRRVIRAAHPPVTALVDQVRLQAGSTQESDFLDPHDGKLSEFLSELRLVKDSWEIDQMRQAIAATANGFEDVVRELPRAIGHPRGERVIEGAFGARAREEGNGLGYDTIAASGANACTLHWIRNDGKVDADDLVLIDAGVEVDSLYTADITRTLPVSGTFSPAQRQVYQAVLDAADAAFSVVGGSMKPFIVFYIKITLIIFDFKMIQLSVGQVNAVKLTFTAIHFKINTEQRSVPIDICKMLMK